MILIVYLIGVVITAVYFMRCETKHPTELIIFCSVFYPLILALGLLTIILMLILAIIHAFTNAIDKALGGEKNGN